VLFLCPRRSWQHLALKMRAFSCESMILTIAIIIIGMTAKIGHTGATCKNAIEITALTTTSEPETRETTGSGATSIPIAKRDAMTGTMTGTRERKRPEKRAE